MTRPRTEELIATYVAGGDLTDEERGAVEALLDQSPAARRDADGIRALLGALRTAAPEPPPASEAVVRAVRIACASPVPWPERARAWLRRRWSVALPVALAAAAAAAVIAVRWNRGSEPGAPEVGAPPAPPMTAAPAPRPEPAATPDLWLDGDATDLAGLDDDVSAEIDRALGAELDALAGDLLDDSGPVALDGLFPDPDLGWVDQLDDAAVDELDRWLAEHSS